MMRTPGIYSDIKVATQRNQLPNQAHKIIFINTDVPKEIPPTDIFDTAEADAKAKPQSNAGRMMAAALMVSQGVDVEMATWTRRREDIKCDYKETFSMPFNADGTATANLYYNHKSYLQTASMTIRQDSVATSYEFLGGATPADAEDIVGCSLLAGGVVDGVAEFTIYGFSKDARFDDGKFDAVEVLLELRPLLTREQVRIDEKFEFVDVIPAASAGMASSEGDVYPHLIEPLVNSCCELVIPAGAGGGGGSGTGAGDGDGADGDGADGDGSSGGTGAGDGDGTADGSDPSGGGDTTSGYDIYTVYKLQIRSSDFLRYKFGVDNHFNDAPLMYKSAVYDSNAKTGWEAAFSQSYESLMSLAAEYIEWKTALVIKNLFNFRFESGVLISVAGKTPGEESWNKALYGTKWRSSINLRVYRIFSYGEENEFENVIAMYCDWFCDWFFE